MPLSSGTRLGPYEIVSRIGAGGMGEVYKARDTRLGRTVAIKIAKQQFTATFEREARAISALNHSNICQLYDVGPNYLVMEYVEGPTLEDRLKHGAVGIEETIQIAQQMAEGIEAAHEKGIIHRDLKPANVKIRPDGVAKVLDFGLASLVDPEPAASSDPVNLPTLTMQATVVGAIIGTASYMAPEQALGKPVDRRADMWAFGVVLWEMVCGSRLFDGKTNLAHVGRRAEGRDRLWPIADWGAATHARAFAALSEPRCEVTVAGDR